MVRNIIHKSCDVKIKFCYSIFLQVLKMNYMPTMSKTKILYLMSIIGRDSNDSHPNAWPGISVQLQTILIVSHKSIFCSNPFKNKVLLLSLFFGISILLSLALIPTVRWVFGLATLTPLQWILTLGLSLLIIPICEVEKCITRAISKRKKNNW